LEYRWVCTYCTLVQVLQVCHAQLLLMQVIRRHTIQSIQTGIVGCADSGISGLHHTLVPHFSSTSAFRGNIAKLTTGDVYLVQDLGLIFFHTLLALSDAISSAAKHRSSSRPHHSVHRSVRNLLSFLHTGPNLPYQAIQISYIVQTHRHIVRSRKKKGKEK
jgi:hypothetical protein